MAGTEEQIKRIQDKLQLLLRRQAILQKENQSLKKELETFKEQASEQQQHVEALRQQVDVLKFSAADMSEADKKAFEKRINGYLKEIDRCIALLGE